MTPKCMVMLCGEEGEFLQELGEIKLSHRPLIGEEISSVSLYDHLPEDVKRRCPEGHAELRVERIRHVEADETLFLLCVPAYKF